MPFFSNTDELKRYVSINISFEKNELDAFLNQTDNDFLIKNLGEGFFNYLQAAYTAALGVVANMTPPQQAIIEKLRLASASYALSLWVPVGQLQIDNSGIAIVSTDNRKTAFQWQINALIKSYTKAAYSALENAILFLEKNIANYPLYAAGDQYTYFRQVFVSNSQDFTKYFAPLNNSRLNYMKMRSCMDKVEELDIQPVLLPTYYNDLKNKLVAGGFTPADEKILPFIRKAAINLTVARAISELNATLDEFGFMAFDNSAANDVLENKKTAAGEIIVRMQSQLLGDGITYLSILKKFLEDNKANYPLYTSDPQYTINETATYTNEPGKGHFYAG